MTWKSDYADYFAARAVQLRRLGYGLSGDWHLADDLVQQTFLQLYRHWRNLDRANVHAYARRTLVNAYFTHRRNRRRETVVADVPERTAAGETHVLIEPDIRRALDALPPRQRALVVLRHMEDVSTAEAAEILGIAEGTVKSQTAHGLAKLRTALGHPVLSGE